MGIKVWAKSINTPSQGVNYIKMCEMSHIKIGIFHKPLRDYETLTTHSKKKRKIFLSKFQHIQPLLQFSNCKSPKHLFT